MTQSVENLECKKTALVVDDDPLARRMTEILLAEFLDYHVQIAGSSEEALAVLMDRKQQGIPLGLLVTDNRMPNPRDGIRLVQQLPVCYRQTPIVMVSGTPEEIHTDVAQLQAEGYAIMFRMKPFKSAELIQTVNAAVALSKQLYNKPGD